MEEVLSKLKKELGINNEVALAESLKIAPEKLSDWKKGEGVDYRFLINKCLSAEIKLHKVFGEAQNNAIIETTVKIFLEKGHAETSIDYFAQKAGLSTEAVHAYYDGKI